MTRAADAMVTGPGVLQTCLSDMLRSIENLARSLPRGRASTLVVLSRGSDYDPTLGTGEAAGCTPRSEAMRPVAETISAAQINVHMVTVGETGRSWGLDTLASNTGSLTGLVSWANTDTLARAVGTPASYYRATFAADDTGQVSPATRQSPGPSVQGQSSHLAYHPDSLGSGAVAANSTRRAPAPPVVSVLAPAGVAATSPSNAFHYDWITQARLLSGHSLTQRTETAICFWPWGPRKSAWLPLPKL